jgi:hypothetical protein
LGWVWDGFWDGIWGEPQRRPRPRLRRRRGATERDGARRNAHTRVGAEKPTHFGRRTPLLFWGEARRHGDGTGRAEVCRWDGLRCSSCIGVSAQAGAIRIRGLSICRASERPQILPPFRPFVQNQMRRFLSPCAARRGGDAEARLRCVTKRRRRAARVGDRAARWAPRTKRAHPRLRCVTGRAHPRRHVAAKRRCRAARVRPSAVRRGADDEAPTNATRKRHDERAGRAHPRRSLRGEGPTRRRAGAARRNAHTPTVFRRARLAASDCLHVFCARPLTDFVLALPHVGGRKIACRCSRSAAVRRAIAPWNSLDVVDPRESASPCNVEARDLP